MNDTVAAIVSAFFVIGILVGVIIVVAVSVLRAGRRGAPGDALDGRDGRSRWPGDADNEFSGR